jgi:hypothetical protein
VRVTLYVTETIPGFAEAGSYILLSLSDRGHPVTVAVMHGLDSLEKINRYESHLRVVSTPTPTLEVLRCLCRLLRDEEGDQLPVRLVE